MFPDALPDKRLYNNILNWYELCKVGNSPFHFTKEVSPRTKATDYYVLSLLFDKGVDVGSALILAFLKSILAEIHMDFFAEIVHCLALRTNVLDIIVLMNDLKFTQKAIMYCKFSDLL